MIIIDIYIYLLCSLYVIPDTSELIKRADKESRKRAKRAHGKSVKQDDSKEHKYERGSRFCTSLKGSQPFFLKISVYYITFEFI